MMFNTRGLKEAANKKGSELEAALLEASEGGKIPIVCDTSPCLSQIKASISEPSLRFALYEPVEFIRHFLVDKLEFNKVRSQALTSVIAVICVCFYVVPALWMAVVSSCATHVAMHQQSWLSCCEL